MFKSPNRPLGSALNTVVYASHICTRKAEDLANPLVQLTDVREVPYLPSGASMRELRVEDEFLVTRQGGLGGGLGLGVRGRGKSGLFVLGLGALSLLVKQRHISGTSQSQSATQCWLRARHLVHLTAHT